MSFMARTDQFYGGAQAAAYHPTSVLDRSSLPTGNGFGQSDTNRLVVGGGILPAHNGISTGSQSARQQSWLDTPNQRI